MTLSTAKSLTVIGVDGVDWAEFEHHTSRGDCPNLVRLRAAGMAGRLVGAAHGDGPAAWATLVTGVQPEIHGLWTREEAWRGGVRPLSRASWKVTPVWARLAAAGVSTGGVAWPGARPGANWPGVWFDEDVAEASSPDIETWALARRTARPDAREAIRDRRTHPTDITAAMLRGLVPDLDRIDQSRDATLPVLAVAMAEAATLQAAALWLLEARRPDVLFLYHGWLGRVRSMFEAVSDERWSQVIPGAWRLLDGLIGRLANGDATVMLLSPGWRGAPGLCLVAGGGAPVSSARRPDMRCLDVAGVILGHFGLTDATAPAVEPDPPEEPDAHLLAQAAAWGFPAPPEAPAAWRAQALTSLAASVIGRDPAAAARIAGEALAVLPGDAFALRLRASALALDDQPDELPALSAALRLAIPGRGWAALAMGAYHVLRDETDLATPLLLEAETDRDPALLLIVAAAWVALARPAAAERVFTAVVALDPANVPARIGLAVGALGRRDFLEVESLLAALMRDDPGNPAVYIQWAHLCRLTGRPEQAMRMATLAIAAGAETAHIETLRMAGLAT